MKTFYYNENKKLYKRIRWGKDILYFISMSIIFFLFFYFLLSRKEELFRPIRVSLFISFLITLGIEISYLIDNKEYVYILKKDILYVIMFQNDTYYFDGDYLDSEKLRKNISEEKINDILSNKDKYPGVSILKIKKIDKVTVRKNHYSFKASGDLSFWKPEGNFFTVNNYVMRNRKKSKKFVVTKEYKDYDELLKYLKDKGRK